MTFIRPLMLRSIWRCQSSTLSSSMPEMSWTPALLNTRSTLPKRSATWSAAVWTAARSVTSTARASAVPPEASMFLTTFSSLSLRRASTTTVAPSSARRSAVTAPMPLEAPVWYTCLTS